MTFQIYSFFHLNMAYSAIEEDDRLTVIERCYWPLLRLARKRRLPFGIELSGYTLETIDAIEPAWVAELRELIADGTCELIGCGYAQVIGPLVPPEVTAVNLRIGHQVYEQLLGCRPAFALLNEQAYSAGLVPLYREAGYRAVIMEWDNPAREHPNWDPEWRYLPQMACDSEGVSIPLIWNKSIAFQKFQRYVHGELELDELLNYVRSHASDHSRTFPLYGNDVEIFDFRPGRYMTEAPLHDDGEWARIDKLFAALQTSPELKMIPPSQVLELLDQPGAGQPLCLESAAQPTPVKKQHKYNLLRWAVTGRDDLGINTRCWLLYEVMRTSSMVAEADWQELCYLWSSDFRTHITESRWQRYQERLKLFEQRWKTSVQVKNSSLNVIELPFPVVGRQLEHLTGEAGQKRKDVRITRNGRFVDIKGDRIWARLNVQRGLALDAFADLSHGEQPLCGTLYHGYYDDIGWGADYYSGHLVFESPGRPKVTDLNPVDPLITPVDDGFLVSGVVATPLGPIEKRWWIDDDGGRIVLSLHLFWEEPVLGSLRLGHVTLLPEAFDSSNLCYRTHNGGRALETFSLQNENFSHGRAVSFLVSANQAVGLTDGIIELADAGRRLKVRCQKSQAAMVAMVTHQRVCDSYFTRLAFSAREVDDTSRPAPVGALTIDLEISVVE